MDKFKIILDLFLMFAAAKVLGEVFVRLRQPAVLGELLAGAILGSYILGIIEISPIYEALAELGVIFLLFQVGLETRISDLREVGAPAVLVGIFGVFVPFAIGWFGFRLLGYPHLESLFIGTALVATSVGITARVLRDMDYLKLKPSRIILGAAILDDILGLMILALVISLVKGSFNWIEFLVLVLEATAFIVFLLRIGTLIARERAPSIVGKLKISDASFAFAIVLCLGLSMLAEYIGLAAIIGAFMAGIVLAETREHFELEEKFSPVGSFLTPFFFVIMGTHIDITAFTNPQTIFIIVFVVLLAVASKVIGSVLGAWKQGLRTALQTGVGMIPRGEVGIIIAGLGLSLKVIDPAIYTVVVSMSILTTIIAPPLIKLVYPPKEETV